MPLGIRIFLVYVLFIGLTGYFVLNTVMEEIRPGVRQSTEETLVDTANLMAEILRDDFKAGTLNQNRWPELLKAYGERQPKASIWGLPKNQVNHRIYVTDAKGVVVLDSSGVAVGQDYSRWNDVLLTLRGEYGARSSRSDPDDPNSSVMHVGAPIRDNGQIIGVVTVAKPNSSLQPYVDRTERRLLAWGAGLIGLGLLFGALLSWWLSAALRRLTAYAQAVSEGRRVEVPHYRGGELEQLATAVEQMKSPLAAIRGAAELLQSEMPLAQQQRFVSNIDSESARMQQLIERLLNLALVEQRQGLEERVAVPLAKLIDELLSAQAARIEGKQLRVEQTIAADLMLTGEPFLLRQALGNLLENALDFTPATGVLRFSAAKVGEQIEFKLFNQAEAIPDYALPRLSERFYSLPRPDSGRKSTGLGLNFVEEVVKLHGGAVSIGNVDGGVQVILRMPA
jgi:two-component system sensor histidine kinase CreC